MSKKTVKNQIPNILFGFIFVVGLCVFLYPSFSNYVNSKNQSRAISNYEDMIGNLTEEDYSKLWQAARSFNEALAKNPLSLTLTDEQESEYNNVLDATNTGIIGYIEIENIGVSLPIYHGTDESVLQVGIGHLKGTSFPTGTPGTHTVLSGHRGLPSSKLFSDLDQMVVGDSFLLHVLDQTFAYQVDQINIVLPDETQLLGIYDKEDYCTLVTCTPYGVNSHRLLVRGKRVEYNAESRLIVAADGIRYSPLLVAPFIGVPILIILIVVYFAVTSRHRRR